MPRGIYKRKPLPEVHKRKIGLARKGKKSSEETKRKISENNSRFWAGKKFSEEYREKLRIAHSNKRWEGHVIKPKEKKLGLWTKTKDVALQLQKKRFRNMRYKARKIQAEGSHTFNEWIELKNKFNNMCLCCKKFEPEIKLTEDHIIPLSLGGSDNIDNIQPLCVSCNTRKMIKTTSYLPLSSKDLIYTEKVLVN